MKNADKIGNVAKQMIGVCNVIINLAEAEESELYNEMLWDELAHTQRLVLEFTKYAFDEENADEEESTEEPTDDTAEEAVEETDDVVITNDNFDEAFFAGELNSKLGDKTDDDAIIIDLEEDDENKVPKGIDK